MRVSLPSACLLSFNEGMARRPCGVIELVEADNRDAAPSMRAWPGGHAEYSTSTDPDTSMLPPSMRAWPGGHAEGVRCSRRRAPVRGTFNEGMARRPCGGVTFGLFLTGSSDFLQ